MGQTVKEVLKKSQSLLKEKGIETYSLDSQLLIMDTLKISKIQLYTDDSRILTTEQINEFKIKLRRRLNNEPIAYIINNCEFMGLEFYVDQNTLIPRPDTEILIEEIIFLNEKYKFKNILDIGTGSGVIPISICSILKNVHATAVDISEKALETAIKNSRINLVEDKINFIQSDLFSNLDKEKFDIIVSNPPYIPSKDILQLHDSVKNFEPHLALDGREDGLYFYKKIIQNAHLYLNEKGILIFEIGYNQGNDIINIMEEYNYKDIKIVKDLASLDRVVYGILKENKNV